MTGHEQVLEAISVHISPSGPEGLSTVLNTRWISQVPELILGMGLSEDQ
jgi:hypothetical protein